MDSIKAQKLQTMKHFKKAQFVYNLVVYSLTAFLSSLFYLHLFCFPSTRQFLFDFLPNVYSFFLSPKFLFLLGNIIVIILVGESKLAGSRSSPATEIYDEYVEKSRSFRRQSIVECLKKDGGNHHKMDKIEKSRIRRHCSLNNIRSLEVKQKEMAGRSLRRPRSAVVRKDVRLEMHEDEKTTLATRGDDAYNIRSLEGDKNAMLGQTLKRPMSLGRLDDMQYENHEKTAMDRHTGGHDQYNIKSLEGKKKAAIGQSLTRPMSLGTLQVQYENEKTTMSNGSDDIPEEKRTEKVSQSLTRPKSLGRLNLDHQNEKIGGDDDVNKISLEVKRKETLEQPMDELNRRVEEFIARVNRQRMLEAVELDSSTD